MAVVEDVAVAEVVAEEGPAVAFTGKVDTLDSNTQRLSLLCSSSPTGIPAPSQQVANVEDVFLKNKNSGGLPDMNRLQLESQLPVRPSFGTQGRTATLWTNYFQVIPDPKLVLYRYHVDISPDVTQKRKRQQLVTLLLELPVYQELQDYMVTDFASTLVASRPIGEDTTHEIAYRTENEDTALPSAVVYKVRIQKTGSLTVSQLTEYLTSTSIGTSFSNKSSIIQDLNILLGHYSKASTDLAQVGATGRSKIYSLAPGVAQQSLGAGLMALRGFFTSVRAATARVIVNVNIAHGVFFEAGPLPNLMGNYGLRDLRRLEKFLSKKVKVQVTHLPVKKNKAGQVIPRIKTIFALTSKEDGEGGEKPKPRVQKYGAGAKEIQFSMDGPSAASTQKTPGKGKKGGPPPSTTTSGGTYITVYDYFKSRKFSILSSIYCEAVS